MLFVLIHRMMGLVPPQVQMRILEITKKREEIAKGAKELASYAPIADQGAICVWETDNVENLMPLLGQLASCGVRTEIIPVETTEVAMKKWEEAIKAAMK